MQARFGPLAKCVADPRAAAWRAVEPAAPDLPKSPVQTRPNSALSTPQYPVKTGHFRSKGVTNYRRLSAENGQRSPPLRTRPRSPATAGCAATAASDRRRSSGGLVRTRRGLTREALPSIQHGGSRSHAMAGHVMELPHERDLRRTRSALPAGAPRQPAALSSVPGDVPSGRAVGRASSRGNRRQGVGPGRASRRSRARAEMGPRPSPHVQRGPSWRPSAEYRALRIGRERASARRSADASFRERMSRNYCVVRRV
jgi:hypothetical protein